MSMYFQKLSRHLIILGLAAGLSAFSTSGFAQDSDNTDGWGNDNQENKEDAPEKPEASETTAPAGDGDRYAVLTAPIGRVKGPKRTVAVGKFATIGSFSEEYGDWDIGGGLSAMMTSALVESDRFIVLERAQLKSILTEQELAGKGVTSGTATPGLGKMAGVQLMIFGAVTEFGAADEGSDTSIGAGGGSGVLGGLLSGAISRQSSSGSFAMDFRIVDTTTGRILETHTVREELESSGFGISLGFDNVELGTSQFYKTPLGQAVRRGITKAVQQFAVRANETAWAGRVVEFDKREIFINAGSQSGIAKGDAFVVERIIKKLTDPSTNEVLMIKKKPLGMVKIKRVMKKISIGEFSPMDVVKPKRGDLVVGVEK